MLFFRTWSDQLHGLTAAPLRPHSPAAIRAYYAAPPPSSLHESLHAVGESESEWVARALAGSLCVEDPNGGGH